MTLAAICTADRRTALGRELAGYLSCVASELPPRLAALSPSRAIDLAAQAERHRAGPLLRERLVRHGLLDVLPATAREALEAQYLANSVRALSGYHELGVLHDRLADAGIPVIALKGIYLARAVYQEPGLRPMGDMDLLFRVPDLGRVQTLLQGLGYRREDDERPIEDFLTLRHHLPPFRRPGAINIEVHMFIERPTAGFSIDTDGLWDRARAWPVGERRLLALAPEDLLLHLCLHGVYHHGFNMDLLAVTDIARVVALEPVDWDVVVERARAWGVEQPAYYGLELSRCLLGAKVPAVVLAALGPPDRAETVLALAERTIFTERSENCQHDHDGVRQASTVGYLEILDRVRALPGLRAKLTLLISYLFPARAVLEEKYPGVARSGWIRLMHGVHWLIATGHFVRRMPVHRRYWMTMRRMDKR